MNRDYDVLVIGGGPAGENAADRAAQAGLTAAIIESDLLGGECSYWGCMPSKALLRPGEALAVARRTPGASAAVTGEIDVEAVLARRDALSGNWDDAGQVGWAEGAGLEVIRGHGRLSGERRVKVTTPDGDGVEYEANKAVIIATGSRAAVPPIPGLAAAATWDNRDITTAKEVPQRLLVLGGGVIGVEMAQAFKSLGSEEVTIIEAEDRLLPREEPFAGEELREALERIGIAVHCGDRMTAASRNGADGPVSIELESAATLEGDELLVAVGRQPVTGDIGLGSVGLESGRYLEVNEHMQVKGVAGGWLYAVGDVNGRALLTHAGKYQARVAGDHIGGKTQHISAYGDERAIPRVVFTDPAIAAVGYTEAQAKGHGLNVSTVQYNIGHIAGSATLGRGLRGTCQLVVDDDRRVLVGATFVGPGVAELVHAATIPIVGEVTLDQLWHAIPAFPTQSEIWLRFLETYGM